MLPTIGVVLAGGPSRRMGEPKALLRLPNGRTFLESALALLSSLTETQIVAGGELEIIKGMTLRTGTETRPPELSFLHIEDLHPGEGPLAGIEAALSTRLGSGYIIIASDQPKLGEDILQRLLNGDGNRIHAFEVNGTIIPLPVYMPQSALSALSDAMTGDLRSLRLFIAANNPELILLPTGDLPGLQSVNTPEEYQELLSELTSSVPSRVPT